MGFYLNKTVSYINKKKTSVQFNKLNLEF